MYWRRERMVFMDLGEGLKKVFLAGVGAVATTAETAKEVIDDLVSKGELTMEQGKVLNEELKRNAKQKVKQHVTVNVTKEFKDAFSAVEHMNAEELEALKEEIRKAKKRRHRKPVKSRGGGAAGGTGGSCRERRSPGRNRRQRTGGRRRKHTERRTRSRNRRSRYR